MEIGETLGLARGFQADQRINDLYQQEEAMLRAKSMAEQKATMFANDTRYQNAMNSFDHARVKERNQKAIYALGAWQRENPNWRIDPTLRAQYQNMVDDIKGNEDVIRGMASDSAFKALDGDLQEIAKTGRQYNKRAYNDLLQQKNNYLQYGNQNGFDAAQKEGYKAFTYIKPKDFVEDLGSDLMKAGDSMKDYNVIRPKNGNPGEWWAEVNPKELEAVKQSKYQQHYDQLQQMKEDNGWNDKQLDEYVTSNIRAGIKKNFSLGDTDALFNRQMAWAQLNETKRHHAAMEMPKGGSSVGAGFSSFDATFKNPNKLAGYVDPKVREVWGDNPQIILQGQSGIKIDLTGKDFIYDNRFVTSNGIKFLTGHIKLSKDEAEHYKIYKQGALTIDGITSDFAGQASEEKGTDKDGKAFDYIKVKYQLPIDLDDERARVKYDALIQPDKTVDIPSPTPQYSAARKNPQGAIVGAIATDKKTGKKYRAVEGGWEEIR